MLVIFDCDGVLVDSEMLAAEVFSCSLKEYEISLSAEECLHKFRGRSLASCFAIIEEEFKALPAHFKARLDALTLKRFARDLRPVPGVGKLLQKLNEKNVSMCVASNGGRDKVVNSLRATGLYACFEERRLFTIDDVDRGKPHPDIYILAAESMGVPLRYTWVIEDSYTGCLAALRAGANLIIHGNEVGSAGLCSQSLRPYQAIKHCESMDEVAAELGVIL